MNKFSKKQEAFWDKVSKCKHKNLSPNYLEYVECGTPLCQGYESHCLDCGAYITECGCGFVSGISGWGERRNQAQWRKNEKKLKIGMTSISNQR